MKKRRAEFGDPREFGRQLGKDFESRSLLSASFSTRHVGAAQRRTRAKDGQHENGGPIDAARVCGALRSTPARVPATTPLLPRGLRDRLDVLLSQSQRETLEKGDRNRIGRYESGRHGEWECGQCRGASGRQGRQKEEEGPESRGQSFRLRSVEGEPTTLHSTTEC